MLRISKAKNGSRVLSWAGKALCSAYDPEKEARNWAQRVKKTHPEARRFIVLGLGAGYQLRALELEFPQAKVYAIEAKLEVVEFYNKYVAKSGENVECHYLKDYDAFLSSELLQNIIDKSFQVVSFSPARETNSEFYRDVQELLLARRVEDFNKYIQQNDGFEIFKSISIGRELLTIKDLNELMEEPKSKSTKLYSAVKILNELVR